jgi:hypothetical protein
MGNACGGMYIHHNTKVPWVGDTLFSLCHEENLHKVNAGPLKKENMEM